MFRTALLVALALLAFAGNSVICRLALKDGAIDAASFTSIRLFSGALLLFLLVALKSKNKVDLKRGSWLSAIFLFIYALTFSYSYISIDTGTGALILFGSVQVTMIIYSLCNSHKLRPIEWLGLFTAFSGLAIFLLPGASSPSPIGFILMTISGIAWACYTLAGRKSSAPTIDTSSNFIRTLPFIALATLFTFSNAELSNQGIFLAVLSGAITSGLGYAIWYSVLPKLTVTQAAVIQLTVPIIAAFGGVIFSSETISVTLMIASALVLGGVLIVTLSKNMSPNK